MEKPSEIAYGLKFENRGRWFYSSNVTNNSLENSVETRGHDIIRNPMDVFMQAIDMRTAGFNPVISVMEYYGPLSPRVNKEYTIEDFGRVVIMGQIIRPVICRDNAEGIKNAREGNFGVAYFGGQTHVFLSKEVYEEMLGRENFENAAIEIFGKDELLKFAGDRAELIKPGYFPEDQVFQIELPSLVVYSDNSETGEKIDPKEKITGLVRLINKNITSKK